MLGALGAPRSQHRSREPALAEALLPFVKALQEILCSQAARDLLIFGAAPLPPISVGALSLTPRLGMGRKKHETVFFRNVHPACGSIKNSSLRSTILR